MKSITFLLSAAVLLVATACKPAGTQVEEPIPSVSTRAVLIDHPVADYNTWRPYYDANDSMRMAHGIQNYYIARGIEDTNRVIILHKIDDIAKAKAFITSPELKTVMDSAGVSAPPTVTYMDIIRDDNSPIDQQERVLVSHHVKDFDAWLKVYDAEGRSKRAGYGLLDRGLARGVEDPNMIYLVFAITDMEKAKSRMASEELKTLMTEAGVDGPPVSIMYRIVN